MAAVALLAGSVAILGMEWEQAGGAPAEGQPAPPLAGRSFSGEAFDLSSFKGKVVVLNFWASWCEPCRSEMPLLDALQRDYRERGVVVLGLSADDRHDRKDALTASKSVAYITGMLAETSSNGFGLPQVLPLTYIIDQSGNVAAVLRANRGALSSEQLHMAVDQALSADKARAPAH
jgi:cytochrome c biogenesis protein CcmG/thiol:disulfide interchange protein DsbE